MGTSLSDCIEDGLGCNGGGGGGDGDSPDSNVGSYSNDHIVWIVLYVLCGLCSLGFVVSRFDSIYLDSSVISMVMDAYAAIAVSRNRDR